MASTVFFAQQAEGAPAVVQAVPERGVHLIESGLQVGRACQNNLILGALGSSDLLSSEQDGTALRGERMSFVNDD